MSSTVTLGHGVQVNGMFTFTDSKHPSEKINLEVEKKETAERTYELAIKFLERDHRMQNWWNVSINGQTPLHYSNDIPLMYQDSTKFCVEPSGIDALKITETDSTESEETLWIDLSVTRYKASTSRPAVVDEKIQRLVEEAKIFMPEDGKKVEKILYADSVGVIIYARDPVWKGDIYFASKEKPQFMKTESKKLRTCRCELLDTVWDIKLPHGESSHKLSFALGTGYAAVHPFRNQWDGVDLKESVV